MENRPQSRQKKITGTSTGTGRRGTGLGTGAVGTGSARPQQPVKNTGKGSKDPKRDEDPDRPKRPMGLGKLIILLLVILIGGGFGGLQLTQSGENPETVPETVPLTAADVLASDFSSTADKPFNPFSYWEGYGYSGYTGDSNAGWLQAANTGRLNSSVDPAARAKRTVLLGRGRDTVTIMIYMCGTDLESQSGMATKDIQEMINAQIGSNVNVLLYTGGCRRWQNNLVSSSANQIYQVKSGGLIALKKNAGRGSMTSPNTLSSFIDFCADEFPANRYMLILWDHGGGSISGFGYDEKASGSGSMTLAALDEALTSAGVKFDIIGFDACLMGSLETGLTMAKHADYLIASEETEPGLGWYYTDWLTALSGNTSLPSIELGRQIVDDYISVSARRCPGQKATLSVVDLAELEATVPARFSRFSRSLLSTLNNGGYRTVANMRSTVCEFSESSSVDQIDLVHMALKLDNSEGSALAKVILSAVKYNRVSSNVVNAYGLAVYFPWQRMSTVNTAVSAYRAIGLDADYTNCIRTFASLESGGQSISGGSSSAYPALSGQEYSDYTSEDLIMDIIGMLFRSNDGSERGLDPEAAARYLTENRLAPEALVWTDGLLVLTEEQWGLIEDAALNAFWDDGEGYIDLGVDNVCQFNENGDLIGEYDGSWLAIDGQPVAYYYTGMVSDAEHYAITGYVPVLHNGLRSQLLLMFTDVCPDGVIVGIRRDYHDGETETIAKSAEMPQPGDTLDFVCDYYTYDGEYSDSYLLGLQHVFTGNEQISNVYIDAPTLAAYRLTDIYNQHYWMPAISGPAV